MSCHVLRLVFVLALLLLGCSGQEGASVIDVSQEEDTQADTTQADLSVGDVAHDLVALDVADVDGALDVADASQSDHAGVDADALGVDQGPDVFDVSSDPEGTWRSALYPKDWTPEFTDEQGRFLHDFSYAGYKNGEAAPMAPQDAMVIDVVLGHGADPTGQTDSTAAIQGAIDEAGAAGGGIVWLPEGLYRVDGRLFINQSGVVLRGAGTNQTKVYCTKTSGMAYLGHITFEGTLEDGHDEPLVTNAEQRQNYVEVNDAAPFSVGDDVHVGWVITPDFVSFHQMTGTWEVFNDSWQPFFHRSVVSIDLTSEPNRVYLDVPLRYPALTRDQASVRIVTGYLEQVGVEELSIGNATDWSTAWSLMQVHALNIIGVKDAWVSKVSSFRPPSAPDSGNGSDGHLQNSGLMVKMSKRVTVTDTQLSNAQNRGSGGCVDHILG